MGIRGEGGMHEVQQARLGCPGAGWAGRRGLYRVGGGGSFVLLSGGLFVCQFVCLRARKSVCLIDRVPDRSIDCTLEPQGGASCATLREGSVSIFWR